MLTSVRVLLNKIIDYAGLFPPARLSMSEAFDRYLHHATGSDGWMLALFVCPASRLDELSPLMGRLRPGHGSFRIAVLGRGGATAESFLSGIAADVEDMQWFQRLHGSLAPLEQFEVALPDAPGTLGTCVATAVDLLSRTASSPAPFFETSFLDGWRDRLPEAAAAILGASGRGRPSGLKIRCGGLDAAAVPSPVAVAAAISAGVELRVPIKATQGLHHPLRHFDTTLETVTHGFLNLFVAGVLAHTHDLAEESLLSILEEEDARAFSFTFDGLSWRDISANVEQIIAAREAGVTSFGSCSFAEPRDDLYAFGLLSEEEPADDPNMIPGGSQR